MILKVNNVEVNDEDEFWNEIEKISSGDIAKLLLRNGPLMTTHIFMEIP